MSMLYHGRGFTHSDVYNMPIYLRNFYFRELVSIKEEESNERKKANRNNR